MKDFETTKVKAIISFLSTEEGGRTSGITTGYRPNHIFVESGSLDTCIGQVLVKNDNWIQPGDSEEVEIEFICLPPNYLELLKVGFEWRINEGPRLVGSAVVTKLL